MSDWVKSVELGTDSGPASEARSESSGYQEEILQELEQDKLPHLSDYRVFIKSSESYRWLVSTFWQHGQLSFGDLHTKSKIGDGLRERLRAQESLRKMSTQRPLSKVRVEFLLYWHPESYVENHGPDHPLPRTLYDILCLTGSWHEAQAMTIADYMQQTWPTTGKAVIALFEQLMITADEETCVCEYR
jgi:hypothetical protein